MINVIEDGKTYTTRELASSLGFNGKCAERSCRNWLIRHGVECCKINGWWWAAGEDIRRAMRMGPVGEDDE